jgi:hypothetical protein
LLAAGAATTLVWYGGGVGASYLWPDAPGARDLRVPLVGPWLALADSGCADNDPDCSTFKQVARAILTAMDGVGQAGGLAVVAEALFLPTAARRSAPRRTSSRARSLRIRPMPVMTDEGGVGLGFSGHF